jgi:hypothetical protein
MWIVKRYKILIVVLAVCILFVLAIGGNLFSNVNSVLNEYRDTKNTYNFMTLNFQNNNYFEKRRNELLNDLDSLDLNFLMHQDQILSLINYYIVKNNIELDNISFGDINLNSAEIEPFNDIDISKTDETDADVIYVSVEFRSSLEDMLSFMDDIRNESSYIAIPSISVLNLDENLVKVSVCLDFYFVNTKR